MLKKMFLMLAVMTFVASNVWAQDWDDEEDDTPAVEEAAEVADEAADEDAYEAVLISPAEGDAVPEPVVKAPVAGEPMDEHAEERSVGRFLLLYIPNIVLNLTDIVSMGVGVGARTSMEVRATRYCQFGGDYGDMFFVEKGYDRRLGGAYDNGYNLLLGPLRAEERYIDKNFGRVKDIVITGNESVVPSPDEDVYSEMHRDFWSIGVEAGWLLVGRVDVHPVEIADFIASIFGFDLTGDSLR